MLVTTYYCSYNYDGRSDANVNEDDLCGDYIYESQWWQNNSLNNGYNGEYMLSN